MSAKSNIQKGKELEAYVRDLLITHGIDSRAERTPGSGNGNRKKGDIDNNIGWCFECKNTKTMQWSVAAKQVAREAMNHQKEVVVWHPKNTPLTSSVAIINIQDFIDLLVAKKSNAEKGEILDRWSIKHNLDIAICALRKVRNDV
jgi:hypothetical protein